MLYSWEGNNDLTATRANYSYLVKIACDDERLALYTYVLLHVKFFWIYKKADRWNQEKIEPQGTIFMYSWWK